MLRYVEASGRPADYPGQPQRLAGRRGRAVRRDGPRAGPDAAPRAARPADAAPALDAPTSGDEGDGLRLFRNAVEYLRKG